MILQSGFILTFALVVCSSFAYGRQHVWPNYRQMGTGQELSMNVDKVWEKNITGSGVIVAVVDDGLNYHHEDLKENYEPKFSYDFVDNDYQPVPVYSGHGTKCAGVIAGKVRNEICGDGIAYNAKIAGIRLFTNRRANDDLEAKALQHRRDIIDIYSNSWGPDDTGYSVGGPGRKTKIALQEGVRKVCLRSAKRLYLSGYRMSLFEPPSIMGRSGKGSIFVFSSGNGGLFSDSCAYDGFVNSIYTIAVGAVKKDGGIYSYVERCSSIITSTFGDKRITCSGKSNTSCVGFGGTSVSAAMASGIIALVLQQNRELSWRDIQHLIVRTSSQKHLKVPPQEWKVNGVGLKVHESLGFGIMDAEKLVETARTWKSVPSQISCTVLLNRNMIIPSSGRLEFQLDTVRNNTCSSIKYIEHAEVILSLKFKPRAFVLMDLTSPNGTTSRLMYKRPFDAITRRKHYRNLVVSSLHYWGEDPNGKWSFLLKNSRPNLFRKNGTLSNLKLTLYGTTEDPLLNNTLSSAVTLSQDRRSYEHISKTKYCGRSTYNPGTHICCSDESLVEKDANCGSTVYNECSQLCCGNRVYEKKVTYPGNYNEYERRCYGQRIGIIQTTKTMYCGRSTYNPGTHICCSDKSLVEKDANCGSTVYNECSQLCCGNKVYGKKVTYPGNYNEYERRCYGQRIGIIQTSKTMYCGRSTYNPGTHICCSDKSLVEKDANCGSTVYNECSQLCCGNKVYEKKVTYPGNYNEYERRCYGQKIGIIQTSKTMYCGRSTYNPGTHICCSDKSLVEKDANCGSTVYNECSQLCCGNRVYEKRVKIYGKIYSNFKRECYGFGTRVVLLIG